MIERLKQLFHIEDTKGHKQFSDYAEEFEYLTNSGGKLYFL